MIDKARQENRVKKINELLKEILTLDQKIDELTTVTVEMSSAADDKEESKDSESASYRNASTVMWYQISGMKAEHIDKVKKVGSLLKFIYDDGFFAGIQLHEERQWRPVQQVYRYLRSIPSESLVKDFVDSTEESFNKDLQTYLRGFQASKELTQDEWQRIVSDFWIDLVDWREEQKMEELNVCIGREPEDEYEKDYEACPDCGLVYEDPDCWNDDHDCCEKCARKLTEKDKE